jgi:hypothetical protein
VRDGPPATDAAAADRLQQCTAALENFAEPVFQPLHETPGGDQ